jgi:hypothetical protein
MATIIEDIGDYLQANGFGTVATDIWLNRLPDSPDDLITIYQIGGNTQTLRIEDVYPAFQFRVRCAKQSDALTKINSIFSLLLANGERRFQTPEGRSVVIKKLQPPYFLMIDDRDRTNYVMTVDVLTIKD